MAAKKEQFANEQMLKSVLKSGDKNIFILFGDDGYLKKINRDKIRKAVCQEDDIFNFQAFGSDCDLQDVYDAVLQFPMMSDKKCVILDDYDLEHCKSEDFQKLCCIVEENPDTCVLILFFDALNIDYFKSQKFNKIVDCAKKNNGIAVNLSHRSVGELVKMLTEGARKRGCSFDSLAARYLVETAGQDINILVNELEKLCANVKDGEITKQTVDEVAVKTIEAKIYDLSAQIVGCNIDLALKSIDELFFMRVDPIIVLGTISSFYVDAYRLFTAKKKGLGIDEVAGAFDYKNRRFTLEKMQPQLKRFDAKRFALSFEALRIADKSLKQFSRDNRTVLEQLAVKLCYIMAKGEGID